MGDTTGTRGASEEQLREALGTLERWLADAAAAPPYRGEVNHARTILGDALAELAALRPLGAAVRRYGRVQAAERGSGGVPGDEYRAACADLDALALALAGADA